MNTKVWQQRLQVIARSGIFRKLFHQFILCARVSEFSKINLYLLWLGAGVTPLFVAVER